MRVFEVPQLVVPGEVAPRRQLPSFVYLAGAIDLAPHETRLPWHDSQAPQAPVVGELARSQGARMASRMIASAKSWLCHPGVDRQAPIRGYKVSSNQSSACGGARAGAKVAAVLGSPSAEHPSTGLVPLRFRAPRG